ncbi:YhbY family RNA-binding protein [Candidatus Woesearchaeota archaeon]|jgi:RNA-binding protein YhbY|nr:YhbY family RNA-binding protein [Candidatus Woesearchaeota archaeon]
MTSKEIQLGKSGLTENFIETLKGYFKKNDSVRISVLRSAGHERDKIKEYEQKLLKELGANYTSKTIGFKIILKKWRKPRV